MSTPTRSNTTRSTTRPAPTNRTRSGPLAGALVVGALAVAVGLGLPGGGGEPTRDLPNPMGGTAMAAPGTVDGVVRLGDLQVAGAAVQMGDVPLDVTVVPSWQVENTGDAEVTFAVGQPRVLEGCCPGPVYVDGVATEPGQPVTLAAGDEAVVDFPLQMHAGMDGWHHLELPLVLSSTGEATALHVTGDFTGAA
ncbi:hypothetical protein [Egicoccus halophilus]|uniref:Uncharacterized protein n=1 Tax=Egicoccus halophilus TaxID=1670830 RepID=A0A8J3A9M4_9ACTN|nr:hypothetical protein [Egicoccus halophilus]GGI07732.1 hypothetical protein GCM10011354_25560 [Egicoccus halophilus]